MEVGPREIVGVVGGSGTGKSVLMKVILNLLPKRAGRVEVFGTDPCGKGHSALTRRWGVLFQDGALFSSLSVMQNIVLPLREYTPAPGQSPGGDRRAQAGHWWDCQATPHTSSPTSLSGGMRKRAGLARALAFDPELLFLDEPTAGLDPIGAADFDELLLTLWNSLGLTVFMITHDLDSLYRVCTRIVVLGDGKVIASGPIDAMVRNAHPWIARYFNGPRGRAAAGTAGLIE